MKRTRLLVFSGVILLALVMALAGCSFFPGMDKAEPAVSAGKEFTRHDYLVLLKTQENHKVSVEELQTIVNKVLNAKPESRSAAAAASAVTGVKKVPLGGENRFVSVSAGRSLATVEEEPVEVYEFAVGSPGGSDEGFVLASNDVRVGHILAIAEGSLDNTGDGFVEFLQACLEDYITATIIEYESITDADIEAAVEAFEETAGEAARGGGSAANPSGGEISGKDGWEPFSSATDFSIVKNTLLLTRWGQGGTPKYPSDYVYNNYVQSVKGLQQLTGCGITAMAQIIAYHNYIIPPSNVPRPAKFTNHADLGTWSGTFNLSLIRTREEIGSWSSAEFRGQVGVLMYYLNLPGLANATYNKDGSTTTTIDKVRSAFAKLGYNTTNLTTPTTITGTYDCFNITENTSLATIKNALDAKRPIYIRGESQTGKKGGHAWVIDGYGTMTFYLENIRKGNVILGRRYSLIDCLMVHCNFGWDGGSDGWYVYGLFDTAKPLSALGRSVKAGENNFSTSTEMFIPYKPQ